MITAKAADLFLQDDTGGIRIPSAASQKLANCKPGQQVSGLLQSTHDARACYVLAHGAGAGMAHRFMAASAHELADLYAENERLREENQRLLQWHAAATALATRTAAHGRMCERWRIRLI